MHHCRSAKALAWVLAAYCAGCGPAVDALDATDVQPVLPQARALRAVTLSPKESRQSRLYLAVGGEQTVGYVVFRQAVSRSGPFWIRVILDSSLRVVRVEVVDYPHQRGRGVLKESFLRQFVGMNPGDKRTVDAVTGATISCRAVNQAVSEAIRLAMSASASQSGRMDGASGTDALLGQRGAFLSRPDASGRVRTRQDASSR